MAKCGVCGRSAGLMRSMCDACIAEQNQRLRIERERAAERARTPRMVELTCSGCGSPMESLGRFPIRTGGQSGWAQFPGEWADLSEVVVPLDMFRCRECRRIEFYDLDLSIPPIGVPRG